MIIVKYEEYVNDYCRRDYTKSFYNLSEFENWFFEMCTQDYDRFISLPNPDRTDIWGDGPSEMEVNCFWTKGKAYWVHQIARDGVIIFSDGKHTNRQKHWNEETKDMCRRMIARKRKPTFNFG